VTAFENVLSFDDPTGWVIPIPDLLNIYHANNRSDVTAGAIEECAAIFFAGAEAVKAAAALAEPALTLTSPTLGESFSDAAGAKPSGVSSEAGAQEAANRTSDRGRSTRMGFIRP
jgi:hypothetical protein